jgi:hypothetical protein
MEKELNLLIKTFIKLATKWVINKLNPDLDLLLLKGLKVVMQILKDLASVEILKFKHLKSLWIKKYFKKLFKII